MKGFLKWKFQPDRFLNLCYVLLRGVLLYLFSPSRYFIENIRWVPPMVGHVRHTVCYNYIFKQLQFVFASLNIKNNGPVLLLVVKTILRPWNSVCCCLLLRMVMMDFKWNHEKILTTKYAMPAKLTKVETIVVSTQLWKLFDIFFITPQENLLRH